MIRESNDWVTAIYSTIYTTLYCTKTRSTPFRSCPGLRITYKKTVARIFHAQDVAPSFGSSFIWALLCPTFPRFFSGFETSICLVLRLPTLLPNLLAHSWSPTSTLGLETRFRLCLSLEGRCPAGRHPGKIWQRSLLHWNISPHLPFFFPPDFWRYLEKK